MEKSSKFRGVLVPALTPFGADLAPDHGRFIAHCRWLLSQGADGLALFGTTSEANSLSVDERIALLEALVASGMAPRLLMPGTGCCALPDSVRLTKHAVSLGCGGVLMLPPFYYKGVSDDGLFAAFAETIDRVADPRLRLYLYHIPPIAQVPIGIALVERLIAAYPATIAGVKDSSGDWNNTKALIERFPGIDIFSGSETFLLANLRHGGVGCISATANVNVVAMRRLVATWREPGAAAEQEAISAIRRVFEGFPVIAALKAFIAHWRGDPDWARPRPPLAPLAADKAQSLLGQLSACGFDIADDRRRATARAAELA